MHKQEQQENYQIFISYRRNGSDAHARVFYEKRSIKYDPKDYEHILNS